MSFLLPNTSSRQAYRISTSSILGNLIISSKKDIDRYPPLELWELEILVTEPLHSQAEAHRGDANANLTLSKCFLQNHGSTEFNRDNSGLVSP
jgi:hypothetical protein